MVNKNQDIEQETKKQKDLRKKQEAQKKREKKLKRVHLKKGLDVFIPVDDPRTKEELLSKYEKRHLT